MRKDLGEKVLSAPIEQIERYRSHRLIPVLTHDVDTISDFAFAFAPLAISMTVTLGYLAMLSWPMFLLMLVAMALGITAQYVARGKGMKSFSPPGTPKMNCRSRSSRFGAAVHKGPQENLVSMLPVVSRAQIAFRRIAELSEQFSSPEPHLLLDDRKSRLTTLHTLQLEGMKYAFPPIDGAAPFTLGPVNLRINQGDNVFIVGENGCGKTTLIKLLLGLYPPQEGEIRIDDQVITAQHIHT